MPRYNHFSDSKYDFIPFNSLKIGEKFRKDFFKNGRRVKDVPCYKTSNDSYRTLSTKRQYFVFTPYNFIVKKYR